MVFNGGKQVVPFMQANGFAKYVHFISQPSALHQPMKCISLADQMHFIFQPKMFNWPVLKGTSL